MDSRFLVAITLPDNLNALFNPLREKFEPGVSQTIPPHVSLTFPFYSQSGLPVIKAAVESVANNFSTFDVTPGGISHFSKPSGKLVIFAQVSPEEKFAALHRSLDNSLETLITYDTSFFPSDSLPNYHPHITLAINGTTEDEEEIKRQLEGKLATSFKVENVSLMANSGQNWKEIFKLPLKKPA